MTDPISRAAVLEILRTPAASDTFPAMIRRVEALEGCCVRVKALEWNCVSWGGDGVEGEDDDGWEAETCLDSIPYRIDWFGKSDFRLELPNDERELHESFEAAKAAAQADYEARIRAALEPVAQPETGEPIDIVTLCAAAPDLRSWTRHDVIVNPDGVLRALEQMAANLDRFRATREPGTEPTPGQFTTMCLAIEDVITGRGFDVDPWQPIETAPKDGTLVLARYADIEDDRRQHWPGRIFVVKHMGYTAGQGYDMGWALFPGMGVGDESLSHWMPLPKPPGETTSAIPEAVKAYLRNALMVGGWRGEG